MAMAPGTVLMTGGWLRRGMFSLNSVPLTLIGDGTRAARSRPTPGRTVGPGLMLPAPLWAFGGQVVRGHDNVVWWCPSNRNVRRSTE
jgi:hypothetical protein